MSGFWIPLLAGAATGVLSAWGIGGGTLLLLVMTLLLGVEPRTAQGINLLYFLPTAGMGLLYHRKNGLLDRELLRRTVPWGLLAAPVRNPAKRPYHRQQVQDGNQAAAGQ